MERYIIDCIKTLKAQLAIETNIESQYKLQMSLLILRQSLEEEVDKVFDLIRTVS